MNVRRIVSKAVSDPRHVVGRLLWHTGFCRAFTIRTDLYRLHFFPTATSCALWVNKKNYEADHQFLREVLQSGDIVVDVGANVGTLSLASAALVGPSGHVYSIEAHPKTFAYLQENISLNAFTQITAIHSAVGQQTGTLKFTDKTLDDQNSVSASGNGIEVAVRPLDELIDAEHVDLLKIDVEGFELFAFRGAKRLLGRTSCIYFECFEPHCQRFNYSPTDVIELLEAEQFDVFQLGKETLERFSGDATKLQNLLAFNRSTAGQTRKSHFLSRRQRRSEGQA